MKRRRKRTTTKSGRKARSLPGRVGGRRATRRARRRAPSKCTTTTTTSKAKVVRCRKNPELLTLWKNPATRAQVLAAVKASNRFHGVQPKHLVKITGEGPPMVALGKAGYVDYLPTRGQRARGPMFRHKFRHTVLAASIDGKRLEFVTIEGKPFQVDWERGIVGG